MNLKEVSEKGTKDKAAWEAVFHTIGRVIINQIRLIFKVE